MSPCGTFYVAMAAAALIVDLIFNGLALVPSERQARGRGLHRLELHDLAEPDFADSCRLLIWRFLKTGGPVMLGMMNRPADHGGAHHHAAAVEVRREMPHPKS
jgi:hypothetical protein